MPTETPREPDRFETATDALERIARAFDANPTAQHSGAAVASILRYLAHEAPAAAPAAGFSNADKPFAKLTAPPSEPVAPAPPGDLVGSNARMAILGAESLAARLTEWAGALRNCLTTAAPAQRAEARIKDLEAALSEAKRFVSAYGPDGDRDLVRRIDKLLGGAGEGTT